MRQLPSAPRWKNRATYAVQLSDRMLIALCDIRDGYDRVDSFARHRGTLGALQRRGLVAGSRLSEAGRLWYRVADDLLQRELTKAERSRLWP